MTTISSNATPAVITTLPAGITITSAKAPLLTTEELTKVLSLHRCTVTKWAREGRIPFKRLGRQFRFDVEAVRGVLGL